MDAAETVVTPGVRPKSRWKTAPFIFAAGLGLVFAALAASYPRAASTDIVFIVIIATIYVAGGPVRRALLRPVWPLLPVRARSAAFHRLVGLSVVWLIPAIADPTLLEVSAGAVGGVAEISDATIWRWLSADAIAPWRHRSWIFPRDPDFEVKAGRVLDLYAGRFEGRRLRRGEYVVSADEKTSIQARCRCHPSLPPAAGRVMRVEHEYERGGALQYLAAWDVHRAKLFGRCEPTTGIEPFGRLVAQVMSQLPYAAAKRVFWIVDNGSSHRGPRTEARLRERWPQASRNTDRSDLRCPPSTCPP